ncbi:helix-turn-helix domain-containing protein [Caproiciproducens sp. NJN-50]|uniref:helix-turn-helix domain-containing protein n=1 Tax=Acutalibacteraceae TaxID=3082771 RepID=UPI000FFE1926|nr:MULTISPECIES: helix-turn-helix transcriptional regulator [Acutalibacteraceae]QAT51078.1 helix-turn-helix domain-containing protein [Caproiciproducens sp. NJN-50]
MRFPERLQELRKKRGMSQESLAQELGVSRQAVSKWESGQSVPETEKLIALGDFFEVSLDDLVRGDESRRSGQTAEGRNERYACRHYEYRSERELLGIPLVHVNLGRGKIYRAKGIVAVGNVAVGLVSVGGVAAGLISLGGVALGLLAFAGFSVGLLLAVGGIAAGAVAVGGLAAGILSIGGLAVGKYAVGGCAVASDIAVGGYAKGRVAVGNMAEGARTVILRQAGRGGFRSPEAVKLIREEYPRLWGPLLRLFTALLG